MSIKIESTTDSAEAVADANGVKADAKPEKVESEASGKKPEVEKTEESDPTENESEAESSVDDESEDDENEGDKKPKKKSGFKRRIEKLSRRLAEQEAQAEHWRKIALASEKPKSESEAKPVVKDDAGKPNPDKFETYADYMDALTDWKIEQRDKSKAEKEREERVRSEVEALRRAFAEKANAFKKVATDFEETIEDVDDIPMSVELETVFLESDNGPELMYELAKNREEYERISKLSGRAFDRAIGAFEARISGNSQVKKETEVKKTKAPPPLKPVGSKSSASIEKDPDEMSYEEYKKWREAKR